MAAAAGIFWFAASAVSAQVTHPHAIAATSLSDYLLGPGSGWLRTSYYGLAIAFVLLGARLLQFSRRLRSRLAAALLFVAGCAVVIVVYSYSRWPLPGGPTPQQRIGLHLLSAFTAFGCITLTLFVATPLLWRGQARRAPYALAATVVALEVAGFTLPHFVPGVYGAFEKLGIATAMIWLIGAALRLVSAENAEAPDAVGPAP